MFIRGLVLSADLYGLEHKYLSPTQSDPAEKFMVRSYVLYNATYMELKINPGLPRDQNGSVLRPSLT